MAQSFQTSYPNISSRRSFQNELYKASGIFVWMVSLCRQNKRGMCHWHRNDYGFVLRCWQQCGKSAQKDHNPMRCWILLFNMWRQTERGEVCTRRKVHLMSRKSEVRLTMALLRLGGGSVSDWPLSSCPWALTGLQLLQNMLPCPPTSLSPT